jgi:hypothetical protein
MEIGWMSGSPAGGVVVDTIGLFLGLPGGVQMPNRIRGMCGKTPVERLAEAKATLFRMAAFS